MRVFFAFHDPAVLYNWIFHSVLNKADFFHYSTRCPQLLLPEADADGFQHIPDGYGEELPFR